MNKIKEIKFLNPTTSYTCNGLIFAVLSLKELTGSIGRKNKRHQ